MALYEVERTDRPGPGEFVNALVIAGGTALAREMVQRFEGVTPKNVKAARKDTTEVPRVLSVYWDESEASPEAPQAEPVPFGDADDTSGLWKS
jgi:hypothetical protein